MNKLAFVIVDDAVFMRNVLKRMIEEEDEYTVVGEAGNGLQAIEQVKLKKPDIVTLDITMPDMNGLEAVEGILEASPETRIIMVSAMGQKSMVLEAIKSGARDFVIKPFEKSRIMQAIRNVMSS